MPQRPLIIGITGGIGSGKTTICRIFESFGAPVFYSDHEAKLLYDTDDELKAAVQRTFGQDLYVQGKFIPSRLAERVFGDAQALSKLNALVHPRVAERFSDWSGKFSVPYVLKEAAVLIESGGHASCDRVVLVRAPRNERIDRVVRRDNTTPEEVDRRMKRQWTDEQKAEYSDLEIACGDNDHVIEQVFKLHRQWTPFKDRPAGGSR